jgi:hypothetical protein
MNDEIAMVPAPHRPIVATGQKGKFQGAEQTSDSEDPIRV